MGRVVIVGAGIAGVATAAALARRGREVLLVEREAIAGCGSTRLNAAIYRLALDAPVNVELALRARALGEALVPGGVVARTGAYYPVPDEATRDALLAASGRAGVREARPGDVPPILRASGGPAVYSPEDGVIDVHALVQALLRSALASGAEVRFGTSVSALERSGGRVTGVVTERGPLEAEVVVDATGPWSPGLAPDSDVGIRPHRRHLFLLDSEGAAGVRGVIWDLGAGYYLRPESGGFLASACDETPLAAGDGVPVDPEVQVLLAEKLQAASPHLAGARIRRWWAGLRPLTADHHFVVGPDPKLPGLFRVGGFGGHGMTAGAAAGEVAAAILSGEPTPFAAELDPGRASLRPLG